MDVVTPYTLSRGIEADYDGLVFDATNWESFNISRIFGRGRNHDGYHVVKVPDGIITVPWSEVIDELQYREGEDWCYPEYSTNRIICMPWFAKHEPKEESTALNRLAAIVCTDASSLEVLHFCMQYFPK